jgi:hypothetical protein
MRKIRTNRDPDRTAAKRIHELCKQHAAALEAVGFVADYYAYLLEYIVDLQKRAGAEQARRALSGFYDGNPRLN